MYPGLRGNCLCLNVASWNCPQTTWDECTTLQEWKEGAHGGRGTIAAFTNSMNTFYVKAVDSLPLPSEGDFGIIRVFELH